MSPKRDRTVRELVEKYRSKYPQVERPLLRRLIRLENPTIFKPESSKLKTLDRELKRSFKLEPFQLQKMPEIPQPKPGRLGFFNWLENRAILKENQRIWKSSQRRKESERDMREVKATIAKMFLDENDPDFLKKVYEIDRKAGLFGDADKHEEKRDTKT